MLGIVSGLIVHKITEKTMNTPKRNILSMALAAALVCGASNQSALADGFTEALTMGSTRADFDYVTKTWRKTTVRKTPVP